MTSRKKRLEKGIESLQEQIEIHEQKRALAEQNGKVELEKYYECEIAKFKNVREKKKQQLEKQ